MARTVELSHAIALAAYRLPAWAHRDPADRILAATARAQGLTLVTADERILAYRAVQSLDARR
jgi:PIN domain nuclease of toxin-antitoxin system